MLTYLENNDVLASESGYIIICSHALSSVRLAPGNSLLRSLWGVFVGTI
jgi:hypothetical protein